MMSSLPRFLSLPRGMSLAPPPVIRRSVAITLTTACRAPLRLLQDVLSVCDHQTSHSGLCCCWALRPRYKRLVDNIFPENPEDGLVKANMEKLTFFALSAPEKLDRIAAYLSERLTRDLHRHRYGYVQIAVEALEQLLSACHSQSINLLVESFLRTLRLLLESERAQLHELATGAFVAFANIQEDSPSYHRSYDFFVSRFSQMCLCENEDQETQDRIRVSGIRGLQGVVRKTVDNEFHINIWEPQHMEQILPALMVNLQTENIQSGSPAEQTELCFRDLLSRAAYGHITNAIKPVLMHLDSHRLWEEDFAVHVFQIIMCSIQHSHLVVQLILGHLDGNSRSAASVRTGIVQVLRAAVTKATGSIGPTVLEVFNTLLRQLRQSVDYELTGYYDNVGKRQTSSVEEHALQDAVVHTIGSFAHTLPVYQRSEVMLFIMGKIPVPGMYPDLGSPTKGFEGSRMIQVMLLKSLLQVCLQYDCSNLLSLPSSFLEPLLCFTLMEDPEIRLLVLRILTSLLDRRHNQDLLETSVEFDVSVLAHKKEHSRHDELFMRKNADSLYRHMFLAFKEESNGRDHFHSLFVLLAVVLLELSNEEVEVDLIRLVLALQELALSNQEGLSVFNRCGIHAVCAAFMNLICGVAFTAELRTYVTKVVESRRTKASFLLPEFVFSDSKCVPEHEMEVEPCCLFVQSEVCEALTGTNIERLRSPYTPQLTDDERLSRRKSVYDVISVQLDLDPENRDPLQKPQEQITFETLKNAIEDVGGAEEEQRRRREVTRRFQTAPFEEIAALCGTKTLLQSGLQQVFELIIRSPPSPTAPRSRAVYDISYPDQVWTRSEPALNQV